MNSKNSSQPWYIEPNMFRRAIAAYPSLQAAIFPPPPTNVTPAQSQDISLYQLLQVSDIYTLFLCVRISFLGLFQSFSVLHIEGHVT